MTKSETISNLKAYLDGDTAIGNIIPLRTILESAVGYLETPQETIKGWVARDKDGCLHLFQGEYPHRLGDEWISHADYGYIGYKELMPNLSWEDEPKEVELIIKSL